MHAKFQPVLLSNCLPELPVQITQNASFILNTFHCYAECYSGKDQQVRLLIHFLFDAGINIPIAPFGIELTENACNFINSNLLYSRCTLRPFSFNSGCLVADISLRREALINSPIVERFPLFVQNLIFNFRKRARVSLARILLHRNLVTIKNPTEVQVLYPAQRMLLKELKSIERHQKVILYAKKVFLATGAFINKSCASLINAIYYFGKSGKFAYHVLKTILIASFNAIRTVCTFVLMKIIGLFKFLCRKLLANK